MRAQKKIRKAVNTITAVCVSGFYREAIKTKKQELLNSKLLWYAFSFPVSFQFSFISVSTGNETVTTVKTLKIEVQD